MEGLGRPQSRLVPGLLTTGENRVRGASSQWPLWGPHVGGMHKQGQFSLRGYPKRETGLLQSPWITQQPLYHTTICNQPTQDSSVSMPLQCLSQGFQIHPIQTFIPHPPGQWGLLRGMCAKSLSHVQLFATPWTVAHQAPLSMGFWSGLSRILEWVAMPSSRESSQPRD